MPIHPHFLVQAAFGASRKVELAKERLVIGRAAHADIVIDEPGLPGVMGLVVHSAGDYYLVADSDKRPFLVNDAPAARKKLCDGDRLVFNECELIFRAGEPEPVLAGSDPLAAAEEENPWSLFRPVGVGDANAASDSLSMDLLAMASVASAPLATPPAPSLPSMEASEPLAPAPPANLLGAGSPWQEKTWGKLIAMHGSKIPDVELTASLALLDLGSGKATLSRRQGQCYATLVSGVVFCSKEKLGSKPKELFDSDLIASGGSVYMLRLAKAPGRA